uniref:Intraflagellar transport protein 56 n=1 Tax=Phytophthora ramorum TaxID=164328 RepID=H3GKM8_PHYRM
MFVSRQPKQVTRASSTSQDKAQLRTKTKPSRDKVFELDTYLDRRDFAGALTLLRLVRRPGNDGQELGPKKTAGTLEGDELYSWRLNTWWVAYCHYHSGDFGEALSHFDQLIEAASKGDATATDLKSWRLSRACCLFYLQNFEDAEHTALSSSRSALCNRLLFLLAHQRQHSEQTLLDRYQQLSRESVEDQLALASTSFVHNNFQEAAEIYKRLLSEGNKGGQEGGSALHVYLALCYFKLGYDDVALELLAVYLIGHPDSFFATNLKASCNFRLYSAREATPILDDYVRRFPNHPCAQRASDSLYASKANSTHSGSAMTDVIQHNLAIFRVSNSESNGIEKHGAATERVLTPLVGHLEEAQLNLVLLHLKRREYHKAFALMEDLEPRTATERALKGVLHAVIGEQTHSKEHIFLAEKCFHAAGSSADDSDTIPGRQCMASYFMLRKEFSDVNVYLSSIATYLSTDDAFNWNYGLSLAATGAYREAEEILARVQSPELRSQLVLCGWLSRCYINNGRAAQAWELYLKVENSQTAFVLLKQIANDCYKAQQFFYAAKAFDVLERLDPDPEYWEGKRGACLGFFRQVATGHENESGATLAHRCDEALKLLGNSKNVLEATKLVTVIRKWTGTFL